ncbi:SAM-dependent methyltransferase [Bacillus sp. AFS040349]|nr:SAM-dependent methyltransferase [Bacillus sp. AFS040349]
MEVWFVNYLQMLSVLGVGGAHPGGLLLTKSIFEKEQFPIPSKILDAGCGTGQSSSYLYQLGYEVKGLDKDPVMIEHAKKRNATLEIDIPYLNQDLSNIKEPNESYDIVMCESVLNFTPLSETLPEIERVLKPNGIVIAIEMIRNELLSKEDFEEISTFYGFPSIFSIEEWKDQFAKHNLMTYKILSENDFTFPSLEEPTTEFHFNDLIPENTFDILSMHEHITLKYQDKLSYRIFFARKK